MTTRYWLRSSLFNILFYAVTLLACIACIPTLLMPRKAFIFVVHGWTGSVGFLERWIMGLHLQVRGLEHLPVSGSYIIAAKHQSAYETMKLHMLFGDPAIILKQELLKIPLWGKYLNKIEPIAIDRSNPEKAISSIQEGAIAVKEQGRPIVIFPQGTRVWTHETSQTKPYKVGVARIQEATQLPIIPVALNTGFFWPRSGWCKRPGKVIFEFQPAIEAGLERSALISQLEATIESRSAALLNEAENEERLHIQEESERSSLPAILLALLLAIVLVYSAYWFWLAGEVRKTHSLYMVKSEQVDGSVEPQDFGSVYRTTSGAHISGFPGPLHVTMDREALVTPTGSIEAADIVVKSWPFPFMPINAKSGAITLKSLHYFGLFTFDRAKAEFTPYQDYLDIHHLFLEQGELQILIKGAVRNIGADVPDIDLVVTVKRADIIVDWLKEQGGLDERTALFVSAGLKAMENDGVVTLPVTSKDGSLYAGPFLIAKLPF